MCDAGDNGYNGTTLYSICLFNHYAVHPKTIQINIKSKTNTKMAINPYLSATTLSANR